MKSETSSLASKEKILNLIACYEQLTQVPDSKRITFNTPDGCHCAFLPYASVEEIAASFDAALSNIHYTRADFFKASDLSTYESINAQMRDRLIAPQLRVNSEVLFVASIPYAAPEDYDLRGGVVKSIDQDRMTCSVIGSFFTMDNVPIHYILGEYDESVQEKHYGRANLKPFLCEQPHMADYFLGEVLKPTPEDLKTLDAICATAEEQAETHNSTVLENQSLELAPEKE